MPVVAAQARTRLRRYARRLAAAAGLMMALLLWLGVSESGWQVLCAALSQVTAGRLQIDAPRGRLLGDWQLQAVRWQDAGDEFEVQQLSLVWSPRELLQGRLSIARLEAASLRFYSAPSDTPSVRPESLRLPLSVHLQQLLLGQLLYGRAGERANVLGEGLEAELQSNGQQHHLQRLQLRLGQLDLTASAQLAAAAPFALTLQAALKGQAEAQPFTLDLSGSGSLEQLQLDGKIVSAARAGEQTAATAAPAPAGHLQARLTPFASQPLAALSLQLRGLDPALLVSGAPTALLDLEAQLGSASGATAALRGQLSLINRRSGGVDAQLLPLQSVHAKLDWQGERLRFDALHLALAGGGRLSGQGQLLAGQLELKLTAQGIDARALHGDLLPTRLGGPLRLESGAAGQFLELDLRDARYAVALRARITEAALALEHVLLRADTARLSAEGRLALKGEQAFALRGRLQNFDPARWLPRQGAPRSVLNAELEASGALAATPALSLHFKLHDSHLGGQTLAGRGDVDLRGQQLQRIAVELEAAGNRLFAAGAYGKPGDSLRVHLQAPKLEALRLPGVAGDARLELALGGSPAAPEFSGAAQVNRLKIAQMLDLSGLSLEAKLAGGAQGQLLGRLRCTSCALPEAGVPALSFEFNADGVRRQHHLGGVISLPGKKQQGEQQGEQLRLALDGGFQEGAALAWRGVLAELRLGQEAPAAPEAWLQLAQAAPLQWSGTGMAFGPARLEGRLGRLQIERLKQQQGVWQSAGRWENFRPQLLAELFPALQVLGKMSPQALALAAEWDFAPAAHGVALPVGQFGVWRESGDLAPAGIALGLDEARLQASLGAGRVSAKMLLRGTRVGEINGDFAAYRARGGGGRGAALINTQAAWHGGVQLSVPDLSWLGALSGGSWQSAGQLDGALRLAGSAARPQLSGELHGQALALRAIELGMRLERGAASVEFVPGRILLRSLHFESDYQPLPRVLALDPKLDVARLTGTPGRLEASGELRLASAAAASQARVSFTLDRLGLMQGKDQWLALSGTGELSAGEQVLNATGKLLVDAGFWSLGERGRPVLSDDVLIRSPQQGAGKARVPRALHLDVAVALGPSVHFRGAGVDSRLAGELRLRSDDAGLPRASGSIQTVDGRFDAYGQKLGIERGIINFQGALDNPGLNILAVRKNLPVEAGVEVSGTAQRPQIKLVSTPSVPDTEKLSWLVLGRSPEQQGSGDNALLLAAAQTILGGQEGGFLSQIQQGLGIDEFGVKSGKFGANGQPSTSRVASTTGFGSSQTVNGQIITVGKRLSANALLSYEQSLNTTNTVVKLTLDLSRQVSLIGRAGTESALDVFWHRSFGK
jgi:translocation and assembly module TamB